MATRLSLKGGGTVPSHESSMRNLAKAWARWRPPRPWRSCDESRIIRRYAFLWYTARGKRPPGCDWARQIGISHTWLQKLVREFTADPKQNVAATGSERRSHIYRPQPGARVQSDDERAWESCACRAWREWQSSSSVNRISESDLGAVSARVAAMDNHSPGEADKWGMTSQPR